MTKPLTRLILHTLMFEKQGIERNMRFVERQLHNNELDDRSRRHYEHDYHLLQDDLNDVRERIREYN